MFQSEVSKNNLFIVQKNSCKHKKIILPDYQEPGIIIMVLSKS